MVIVLILQVKPRFWSERLACDPTVTKGWSQLWAWGSRAHVSLLHRYSGAWGKTRSLGPLHSILSAQPRVANDSLMNACARYWAAFNKTARKVRDEGEPIQFSVCVGRECTHTEQPWAWENSTCERAARRRQGLEHRWVWGWHLRGWS